MKPEVISTFSDASETMLRDMNRDRPRNDSFVSPQLNLVSMKDLTLAHRLFHCYFVDFDARFFNSKCVSEAFVDLLRSTYAFSYCIFFALKIQRFVDSCLQMQDTHSNASNCFELRI